MQWYDWYTGGEGLYCASEDVTHQTVGLHIERDAKLNVLRFGFIRYPMIDAGERFTMEMTGKTTLLLGGSAQAHMFARTDLAYSAASQDAGAGMGYLVQDGHAVKLKAVQK